MYFGNAVLHDAAWTVAERKLKEVDNNPFQLPDCFAVVISIMSAQVVIDNGGLSYFFESDWPNSPPYENYSRMYRLIGANRTAAAIDNGAALFGISDPHLNFVKRQDFILANLDSMHNGSQSVFDDLDGQIYDDEVWEKLDAYIIANASHFEDAEDAINSIGRKLN